MILRKKGEELEKGAFVPDLYTVLDKNGNPFKNYKDLKASKCVSWNFLPTNDISLDHTRRCMGPGPWSDAEVEDYNQYQKKIQKEMREFARGHCRDIMRREAIRNRMKFVEGKCGCVSKVQKFKKVRKAFKHMKEPIDWVKKANILVFAFDMRPFFAADWARDFMKMGGWRYCSSPPNAQSHSVAGCFHKVAAPMKTIENKSLCDADKDAHGVHISVTGVTKKGVNRKKGWFYKDMAVIGENCSPELAEKLSCLGDFEGPYDPDSLNRREVWCLVISIFIVVSCVVILNSSYVVLFRT